MKAYNRVPESWAKEYKACLSDEIRQLISMANFDLYCGPGCNDSEYWHGFSDACLKIRNALDDIPDQLWVDVDCENYSETEPEELFNIVLADRKALLTSLVGPELVPYIR